MATGLLAPSYHFKNHALFSAPVLGIGRFNNSCNYVSGRDASKSNLNPFRVRTIKEKTEEIKTPSSSSPEDVTKKYGLEAGLWKVQPLRDINIGIVICDEQDQNVIHTLEDIPSKETMARKGKATYVCNGKENSRDLDGEFMDLKMINIATLTD